MNKIKIDKVRLDSGELVLLDSLENYCAIKIRKLAFENLSEYFDMAPYVFPRPTIYDIARKLLLEKEPEEVLIESQIEGEYSCVIKFDENDFLKIRPSDAIILFLNSDVPLYIDSKLMIIKKESEKPLQEQLEEAIANENYQLAAELKKKIENEV